MKKAWKTLLPLALCLLLLLSCLSGCGPSEDPADSDAASTEASAEASTEDATSADGENSADLPADSDVATDTSVEDPTASEPAASDAPTTPDAGGDDTPQDTPAATTAKTTVSNVKETTVKVDGLVVHSGTTPYVTGGQLPIRILMPYPQEAADMNKQAFAAHYEAMSGMRVDYSFYIGSDIFVLTQTMMSSGNLPDIFMSVPVGFTCAKVSQYGKEGYFADLTGKLQTWAPNAYKQINSKTHPYAKAVAYAPGKVYSLPTIFPDVTEGGTVNKTEERQLMINTAWLDELGLGDGYQRSETGSG